jgi:hypothetical protein
MLYDTDYKTSVEAREMPYMSIRDDSHPFLVFVNNAYPFSWNTGFMYSILLESSFIRINSRGIQYSQTPLVALDEDKWKKAACAPTEDALCAFVKDSTKMLLFPTTKVDIPDKFGDLNPSTHYFLKDFSGTDYSPCTYKNSNRDIKVGDNRYEVSLCDVLDANLDFVLDLETDTVYWRQDKTPTLLYIIYSILAIYLISLMTNNIINILTKYKHDKVTNQSPDAQENSKTGLDASNKTLLKSIKDNSYVIFLLSTLLFLSIMAVNESHKSKTLVTQQDRDTVMILVVYVSVQFLYHYYLYFFRMCQVHITSKNETNEEDYQETRKLIPKTNSTLTDIQYDQTSRDERDTSFSLLVAFILLLIMLVYKTFDTPYLTLMTTLFLMRSWLKLFLFRHETQSQKELLKMAPLFLSTCLDFVVAIHLLLLVESSVKFGSSLSSAMYSNLHLFVIILTSFIVALCMKTVKSTVA